MALPTYDKTKRKKQFTRLPKGAYVIEIKGAKEEPNRSGKGSHLTIAFDIAEGEYKGFYAAQFEQNSSEDKKWPYDAIYYLTVPEDGSASYVWDNWNTFFADLEDSNNGFVFTGDPKPLKGKLIGGKFHNEQAEYPKGSGKIYDHTRLRWTCVADDVRNGKPGAMPQDKLMSAPKSSSDTDGWMKIPDGAEDELPF